nr:unnamed protein product [Digitaria exilis]
MTLPYWAKVRSSVDSVVSHESPPTKIRPTFSSAIPDQIKSNPLVAAAAATTCTGAQQPNPDKMGGAAAAHLARRPRSRR